MHRLTPSPIGTDASTLIDRQIERFFGAFSQYRQLDCKALRAVLAPEAVVRSPDPDGGLSPPLSVDEFIEPRKQLLESGRLEQFSERELWSSTFVCGSMAQRWSLYRKAGRMNGLEFDQFGFKSFQLELREQAWRINSLSWRDLSPEDELESLLDWPLPTQILRTDRTYLRPLQPGDASFLRRLASEERFATSLGVLHPPSTQDALEAVITLGLNSYAQHGYGLYHVCDETTDRSIGLCGLIASPELRLPRLSIAIAPEYRHRGLAREVVQGTLAFVCAHMRLSEVVAIVGSENVAATNLLAAAGMERIDATSGAPSKFTFCYRSPSSHV